MKIKKLKRLEYAKNTLGNIEVFYALYRGKTDFGEIFAVAVGEAESISVVTFDDEKDGRELYRTVSENDVGEVSFCDVADDFMYERKETICCDAH